LRAPANSCDHGPVYEHVACDESAAQSDRACRPRRCFSMQPRVLSLFMDCPHCHAEPIVLFGVGVISIASSTRPETTSVQLRRDDAKTPRLGFQDRDHHQLRPRSSPTMPTTCARDSIACETSGTRTVACRQPRLPCVISTGACSKTKVLHEGAHDDELASSTRPRRVRQETLGYQGPRRHCAIPRPFGWPH